MNDLDKEFWDDKEVKPQWAQNKQAPLIERSKLPGPWEVQKPDEGFCGTAEMDEIFRPKSAIATSVGHLSKIEEDFLRPLIDAGLKMEQDPLGYDAHQPGAKLDAGKNRLGLVLMDFASPLLEVGKVGTYGAKKYTDHGWISVPDGESRYTDAMLRHWFAECQGENYDQDTHLLHAAHLAWNALARLRFIIERLTPKETSTVAANSEESCPQN